MEKNSSALLDNSDSLSARASHLRLAARTIAAGMKTGSFRALRRGHGIEFSGVREYFTDDDVRSIDWNVTARMNKPYVKLFDEEREMVVFVVVDCSLSMETGFGKKSRFAQAIESAALITLASEQNGSPVGAVLFDGELRFSCSPKSGRNHAMTILRKLDTVPEKIVTGSVLPNAIKGTLRLLKKKSLVVIVSDFRCAGYEAALSQLAVKHDVVCVNIMDPVDSDFPSVGTLRFFDPETKQKRLLPTSHYGFKKMWKQENQSRIEKFQTMCTHRGASPVLMTTQDDPVFILGRFFKSRSRR
jgi:uncharacterized protein (DUF58 family)